MMIFVVTGIVVLTVLLQLTYFGYFTKVPVKVKYSLIATCLAYAIWTFAYLMLYNSPDIAGVVFWFRIASIGFLAVPASTMLLFINLSGNEKSLKMTGINISLAVVLAVFYYVSFTGIFALKGFTLGELCYVENVDPLSPWLYIFLVYFAATQLFGFMYYSRSTARRGTLRQKQHARYVTLYSLGLLVIWISAVIMFGKGNLSRIPFSEQIIGILWIGIIWSTYLKYFMEMPSSAILNNQVLEIIDDMLFVVNHDNKIVLVNPAVSKLLEYERKELLGKDISLLFEENTAKKITNLHELLKIMGPGSGKTKIKAKDGELVDVTYSLTARSESPGDISWVILLFNDIRELLNIEKDEKEKMAELRKVNEDLEQTQLASINIMEDLDRKSKELTEAYEELKEVQEKVFQTEKMAAIGKLAGGVAHEINNPMTVILGYAQSLVKRILPEDRFYTPLKAIEREALRSKKLIDDLLTFSRTSKAMHEKVDINLAVESALTLADALSKVRDVNIERDFGKDIPFLFGNKNQLQQVIINLCNNAIDAIRQIKESGTVNIKTFFDGEFVNIRVKDDGAGISKEIQAKIFEPFFTTKEVGKGTGLGLSLCYEIVQKHKGDILVESEPGKGAAFIIKLPLGTEFVGTKY